MINLIFHYGTMNSSKSANLLMVAHNYREQGKKTLVFKPSLDTRDGEYIKSRALSEQIPAYRVGVSEVGTMFRMSREEKPYCVLVDEVQFMSEDQIDELSDIVDSLGIPVIVFGLLTDFQSNIFVGSRRLVELGAKMIEVKTVCWYCSDKATFNLRFDNGDPTFDGDQLLVGGNESYRPVCRKCYKQTKSTKVEPRMV